MTAIKIVQVRVSDLKPSAYNPRKWDKTKTEKLKESIKRFGLVDPLIVNGAKNRKNIVIGGHFRLKVVKEMGYKEVPVVYVNIPEIEKEKELNLRLNQNTGEWDYDLLKEFDFDFLKEIGFEEQDLMEHWDDGLPLEEDEFDTQKELAKIKKAKTKPGDVIELGNHKLVCGDSTDPKVIKKLLGNTKISMIYSDPPYNLNYDYQRGMGKKGKYGCSEVKDNLTRKDYQNFIEKTLQAALPHCDKNLHVFYYCDQNYVGMFQNVYTENKITNRRTCLWIKNSQNVTPQIAFNKCYECCVYGTHGRPYLNNTLTNLTEIMNANVGNGNQTIDDLAIFFDLWFTKRLPTSEYLHPTEKPTTLHAKPIKRCTKPGDNILDLFGGSGSTLAACEQLNRRAFLVEKDPVFCDVIVKRFEKLRNEKK